MEPFTLMEPLRPLKVVLARNLEKRSKGKIRKRGEAKDREECSSLLLCLNKKKVYFFLKALPINSSGINNLDFF